MRRALLDYLRDYYKGEIPEQIRYVDQHFGMSADELGRRVVAWARAVQEGKLDRGQPTKR